MDTALDNALLARCAQKYGTPLYVYDFHSITTQFQAFKDAFKARKSLICYALKANPNLSIISHLAELGSGADCVSIGEVRRALLAGIPKYKIIYSGVGKRDDEIREALRSDILFLNVESRAELERIESIAKELGLVARISVRVNPNIDAKTHPYISTGFHENKFGVDIQSAKQMYIYAKNSPHIKPIGIHFHIGSQLTDLEPIKQGAQKIAELTHSLLALKIEIRFFDVGGGVGIRYTDEREISLYDYAQAILAALRGLDVSIICEPGRYIVGKSGVLLSKVLYEKHNGHKRCVIVDAAMNDLMRPALYNAVHTMRVVQRDGALESNTESSAPHTQGAPRTESSAPNTPNTPNTQATQDTPNPQTSKADVVGAICESSDFLAKDIALPTLAHSDIVAFENVGAYGYSMAHTYNTRPRAAEVGVQDGEDFLIKPAETFESLVASELETLRQRRAGLDSKGGQCKRA